MSSFVYFIAVILLAADSTLVDGLSCTFYPIPMEVPEDALALDIPGEITCTEYANVAIVSGDPKNVFNIQTNGVSSDIVLDGTLDYEKQQMYQLFIGATFIKAVWNGEVNITVLDVNDNPPVCEKQIYEINITSDFTPVPVGTSILNLTCSDKDLSNENSGLTYTIIGDPRGFNLDNDGKVINIKELKGTGDQYKLTVRVSDGTFETNVTVLINEGRSSGNSTDSSNGDSSGNSTDSSNECNGGIVVPWNDGVQCLCPPHKQGRNCTDDVPDVVSDCEWPSNDDACSTDPCYGKGSVCINTFGENYKCLCPPGMEGDQCDTGSHCFSCSSVRWRNVTCSVFDDAAFLREMNFSGPPIVTTQMSRTKCRNDKWGFDAGTGDIWVAKGCRAKFCIEFEKSAPTPTPP
ncbi:unnamed protein product [Owenia fusiformis]|uniref:Uncharacterized protein n=1 Tax=Owenia fusiformis TaxID=6347 RepID=A0A8S4PXS6_OWEFU|nr:unnamed protein product [Owenia fusiformis]